MAPGSSQLPNSKAFEISQALCLCNLLEGLEGSELFEDRHNIDKLPRIRKNVDMGIDRLTMSGPVEQDKLVEERTIVVEKINFVIEIVTDRQTHHTQTISPLR
ncbi:hypothetical protein DPMN_178681 [Dreissena polymorpha]|uniref:Uncharacterized protein n=1 Tax=Dreissena polymorpha TaxID=45954 RepID=A0A9D4ECM3_DREPO|nr:hypothetical protein DPMN_178681 [Dreissena polymorpha]